MNRPSAPVADPPRRAADVTARRLRHGLLPLATPPAGPGWNRALMRALHLPPPQRDASVLLAVLTDRAEPEVIFTRRNAALTHHAGQVSFPGGGREPQDRDALATAVREAQEEIALPPGTVEPLGYLERLDTTSGFCVTPVVALVHGRPPLRANPDEVAEVFRVPLDYLLQPDNFRDRQMSRASLRSAVPEVRYGEHVIWGATAMMLVNLQRRLGLRP